MARPAVDDGPRLCEITAYLAADWLWTSRERIKTETHRYVRHQYTWFPHGGVQWFDMQVGDSPQRIMALAEVCLGVTLSKGRWEDYAA